MRLSWRNAAVVLLLCLIVAACQNGQKDNSRLLNPPRPDPAEIKQVINRFLQVDDPVAYRLWAEIDGKTVASMKGTATGERWQLEGDHVRQSFVRLSGRGDKVEWQTDKEKNDAHTSPEMFSPRDHMQQLKNGFQNLTWAPDSNKRSHSGWKAVEMSLTDDQVEGSVQTMLGDQMATPEIVRNVAQKMEVRYTLWYNGRSLDLHQIQVDVLKSGDTRELKRRLIYLFGESSE